MLNARDTATNQIHEGSHMAQAPAIRILPGTQVLISDGNPMPPVRFKRKMEEWQNRNYPAVVLGDAAGGGYRLQFCVGLTILRAMIFLRDVGPQVTIVPIQGAPLAPLTEPDGMGERHVDTKAWLNRVPMLREAAKASHYAITPTGIIF